MWYTYVEELTHQYTTLYYSGEFSYTDDCIYMCSLVNEIYI